MRRFEEHSIPSDWKLGISGAINLMESPGGGSLEPVALARQLLF
jgi:hypothetical protein